LTRASFARGTRSYAPNGAARAAVRAPSVMLASTLEPMTPLLTRRGPVAATSALPGVCTLLNVSVGGCMAFREGTLCTVAPAMRSKLRVLEVVVAAAPARPREAVDLCTLDVDVDVVTAPPEGRRIMAIFSFVARACSSCARCACRRACCARSWAAEATLAT